MPPTRLALVCALLFFLRVQPAMSQTHPPFSAPSPAQQHELEQNLQDVHFDFNRFDLSPQDHQALETDANWLKANPTVNISIRGEADERGSVVYNLALSQKRAEATREGLIASGVPADRIVFATGWGKLYPVCMQSDESCWGRNRRAHFTLW
jgi:peptidoglycan-associated lipoprotein